jgi:hypothetical protein
MSWDDVRKTYLSNERISVKEIDDFWIYCGNLQSAFPSWRNGQTYANAIDRVRPDLSKTVLKHSKLDTYYQDDNIPAFVEWLYDNWTERQPVMLSIAERDTILRAMGCAESIGDITFLKACDVTDRLYDMEFESEGN